MNKEETNVTLESKYEVFDSYVVKRISYCSICVHF